MPLHHDEGPASRRPFVLSSSPASRVIDAPLLDSCQECRACDSPDRRRLIVVSVLPAIHADLSWLRLTGIPGGHRVQAPFTGFCPAAMMFKRLGLRSGPGFA